MSAKATVHSKVFFFQAFYLTDVLRKWLQLILKHTGNDLLTTDKLMR